MVRDTPDRLNSIGLCQTTPETAAGPDSSAPIGADQRHRLAVMDSTIARNFARNGYTVALHNRSVKTDTAREHGHEGNFIPGSEVRRGSSRCTSNAPGVRLIMVQAGAATDAVIESLAAMEPGDVIIDGGNALYTDTIPA